MTAPGANSGSNPGPVREWEELGRSIFSRLASRKAASNDVPAEVFLERADERKISVDRLTIAPPADAVANAEKVALSRTPRRNFYGWAVVTTEKVRAQGCGVIDSPLPDNPYHADIELPDSAMESRDAQREYAAKLARISEWRPRPLEPDAGATPSE